MSDISLKLDERTVEGKQVAKLRRAGIVPSVVYGNVTKPLTTQSELVATTKVVHSAGRHTPVYLTIGGKKKLAIIKSIDFDPVKHSVRHVAFHAIKQNEKITTEVPIVLAGEGESPAEKAGLVVLQAIESLEVKALPANLPESLEISIVSLENTEDKLTVADIQLPEGVEFADPEQDTALVVANVYEPSALQAANEAAAGEAEDVSDVEAENGSEETESSAPATGASDNE
jgi:large subunit ribosomal protein L25